MRQFLLFLLFLLFFCFIDKRLQQRKQGPAHLSAMIFLITSKHEGFKPQLSSMVGRYQSSTRVYIRQLYWSTFRCRLTSRSRQGERQGQDCRIESGYSRWTKMASGQTQARCCCCCCIHAPNSVPALQSFDVCSRDFVFVNLLVKYRRWMSQPSASVDNALSALTIG